MGLSQNVVRSSWQHLERSRKLRLSFVQLTTLGLFSVLCAAPAAAQITAKRLWTNAQGKSEETEFQRLGPGGVAVFKSKNSRAIQVPMSQLGEVDQQIAQCLYLAAEAEESGEENVSITPFGTISWGDTPSQLLTKLHADGFEMIEARVKKRTGRSEYDVPVIERQLAEAEANDNNLAENQSTDTSPPQATRPTETQLVLSTIPLDASVTLVDIKPAVLSSDWDLIIEAGPVWIEGAECRLVATFESNYGLLVDQQESLNMAPLPDDGVAVGPAECILPCLLSRVTVEFMATGVQLESGIPESSIKSLHSVLMEKYRPLLQLNIQLAVSLSASANERPDLIKGRANQIIATVETLPPDGNRVNLRSIFTGSESGFSMTLMDAGGHGFQAAVGRTQGTRSGMSIIYDVGTPTRSMLKQKADSAKFRTASGGRNRSRDI